MQLILDNLIAIMVASSLAVLLLTQQTSTKQDAMERQSVRGAKVQSLAFAEWVERDIVRLGARFGADRDRFTPTAPTMIDGKPFTTEFEFAFNEAENSDDSVDRVQIKYVLVEDGAVLAAEATPGQPARYIKTYRLDRSERSGRWKDGGWVDTGGNTVPDPVYAQDRSHLSPAGLSYFYIEPRTSDGVPLTDPSRAREADYIRVQFAVLPTLFPIHRARYIRETGLNWASTFEIRPF